MDESKKTDSMNTEESEKVVKTRKKIKVRFQNPVVVEKTAEPIAEEPAETETEQKPRGAFERAKDIAKGVGLGILTVLAVGSAYVWATTKPEPEPLELTDGDYPEEDDEEEDSGESDGSDEAPSED